MFDGLDDFGAVDDHPPDHDRGGHEDMLLLAGLVAEGERRPKAKRHQWGCMEILFIAAFILLLGFIVLQLLR